MAPALEAAKTALVLIEFQVGRVHSAGLERLVLRVRGGGLAVVGDAACGIATTLPLAPTQQNECVSEGGKLHDAVKDSMAA